MIEEPYHYDSLGLLQHTGDFDALEAKARHKDEDIIQVENDAGLMVDLGWYRDRYRVYLIEKWDWENPLETRDSRTLAQAMADVRELLNERRTL